jgi:cell division protein FtsB
VEAIKEQQKQISNQNEQIESQKQENLDLKARLNILEKRIDEMESLNHK